MKSILKAFILLTIQIKPKVLAAVLKNWILNTCFWQLSCHKIGVDMVIYNQDKNLYILVGWDTLKGIEFTSNRNIVNTFSIGRSYLVVYHFQNVLT